MNATGYPTLLNHLRLSTAIGALRAQHARTSQELVTGRIADPARALGAGVGAAALIGKALSDIGAVRQSIATAQTRAAATQLSLSAMAQGAGGLSADISDAVARNEESSKRVFGASAESRLRAAVSALNQRVGDATLFSGDAVDRPAIATADALLGDVAALYATSATAADFEVALDFYFNDPAGGFSSSIYDGGAGSAPRADIGGGELVSVSARGDEQPIKDLMRSLAAAAAAGAATAGAKRDGALIEASSRLRGGADGVAGIAARIGVAEERMEIRMQRLNAEETAFTEAYNGLTARDPYEAASRLQRIEAALEASLTIAARLSQLTLTRFLAP